MILFVCVFVYILLTLILCVSVSLSLSSSFFLCLSFSLSFFLFSLFFFLSQSLFLSVSFSVSLCLSFSLFVSISLSLRPTVPPSHPASLSGKPKQRKEQLNGIYGMHCVLAKAEEEEVCMCAWVCMCLFAKVNLTMLPVMYTCLTLSVSIFHLLSLCRIAV